MSKPSNRVKAAGYSIHGATRNAVPRGFDTDRESAGFLLHEGVWAELEGKRDKSTGSPAFVDFCARHYAAMRPLGRWLLDAVS